MNFIKDYEYVTIKATGKQAQVVHYIGSNIFKLRFRDGNVTRVMSFTEDKVDWGDFDKEAIKKRYR